MFNKIPYDTLKKLQYPTGQNKGNVKYYAINR